MTGILRFSEQGREPRGKIFSYLFPTQCEMPGYLIFPID